MTEPKKRIVKRVVEYYRNYKIIKIMTPADLIYNAVKPAVLVECGFLSNYEEAENLKRLKKLLSHEQVCFCRKNP